MSAFLCNDDHIKQLAIFYADTCQEATRIANELKRANLNSVNYRYDEDSPHEPIHVTAKELIYRNICPLPPVHIIKMCHCLGYQCCESPTWETSKAKALLDAIICCAVKQLPELPGYEQAPWEYFPHYY